MMNLEAVRNLLRLLLISCDEPFDIVKIKWREISMNGKLIRGASLGAASIVPTSNS